MCAVRDKVAAGDVPGNSNSAKKSAGTTATGSVESKEGGGGEYTFKVPQSSSSKKKVNFKSWFAKVHHTLVDMPWRNL